MTTTATAAKKKEKSKNPLFVKRTKNLRVGGDMQPKRDLTRYVKWPKYVLIQRQKRVLMKRLKVPPAINQFSHTLDSSAAKELFKLLFKYQTEEKKAKRARLAAEAKAIKEKKELPKKEKPTMVKFGLNHVTSLIENGKAQLVAIAHNVEPIELVLHLPALCRKKNIPYCFVKGMERLGKIVHKKSTVCVAITDVKREDFKDLDNLKQTCKKLYNDNADLRKEWGGSQVGIKSSHKIGKQKKAVEHEVAQKADA